MSLLVYRNTVDFCTFNVILEVPATAVSQEKENTDTQIGNEELKVSHFADDMTLYVENPKDSTKVIRSNIQIQQSSRI